MSAAPPAVHLRSGGQAPPTVRTRRPDGSRPGLLLRSPRLRPFRFALTGGTAGLVQLGLLRGLEAAGTPALAANGVGFLLAAQVNFLLSQAFTWADRAPSGDSIRARWVRFHLSIAGTALLNMLVFAVARLALSDLIASVLGIAVAAVANYLLGDRFIFRGEGPGRGQNQRRRGRPPIVVSAGRRVSIASPSPAAHSGQVAPGSTCEQAIVTSAGRRVVRRLSHLMTWESVGPLAVLGLAAFLMLVRLDRQGYGNTYYAAAVKSMLTSWQNFLFASFDSGGFVAVDKPPLGLWVQAASVWLFGFNGPSLFLPQIVSGLLSVAVVYWLVRRAFGPVAGLLAGLALAVTPINAVTARNNTMDSLLVLVLLLAAWAATLAAERGRLGMLLSSALLVGLAYNVKMLQAFPTLPAFWLPYLLWAPRRLRARVGHLALATVVLGVVSLSWSAVVDLTPPDRRPYVGSSGSNSALSLALGYNGLGRLTQAFADRIPLPNLPGVTIDLTVAPGFAPQIGTPGLSRLLRPGVADQASWLLPLAVLGLLVAGWQATRGERVRARSLHGTASTDETGGAAATDEAGDTASTDETGGTTEHAARPDGAREQAGARLRQQRVGLAIWGGWLLVWGTYFTVARFYHLYYLVMLGPAVAALSGIGVAALWRVYRQHRWSGLLLPLGLLGTAALQLVMLARSPSWGSALVPLVLVLTTCAALALVGRLRAAGSSLAALGATVGVLALLVAPSVWAGRSALDGAGGAWLPEAGPGMTFGSRGDQSSGTLGDLIGRWLDGSASQPNGSPGVQNPGNPPFRFNPGAGASNDPGVDPGQGRGPASGPDGNGPSGQGGQGAPGRQSGPGGARRDRNLGLGDPAFGGPGVGGPAVGGPGTGGPGTGGPGTGGPGTGGPGFGGPGFGGGPRGLGAGSGGMAFTFAGEQWNSLDPALVRYLEAHQGSTRFLVATPTSSLASLFMLVTDQPAMALGGYQGWDRILTPSQLATLIGNGTVRFFLLGEARTADRPGDPADATADLAAYVRSACAPVPGTAWESGASGQDGSAMTSPGPAGSGRAGGRGFGPGPQGQQLYDCGQLVGRTP